MGVKADSTREEADEWLARYPDDAAVMAYIGCNGWNTLTIGGVGAPTGESVSVNEESAVVRHDGTTEDTLLRFDVFTSAQDVALILPLPAKAELDVADVDTLGQLQRATASDVVERRVLRGPQLPVIGCGCRPRPPR